MLGFACAVIATAFAGKVFSLSRFTGLCDIGDTGSWTARFVLAISSGDAAGLELDAAALSFASALAAAPAFGLAPLLGAAAALGARGGSATTAAAAAAAFFSLVSWSNFSMICSRV